MAIISIQNSLQQRVFRDLQDTWKENYVVYEKLNSIFARQLVDNNVRKASYAWKESIPFPRFWPMDSKRAHQTFQDRLLEVSVYPYELTIDVRRYDIADDQLADAKSFISAGVKRFLQIPQKLYAEHLNGVADLNPEGLRTAYDGSGTFATVDGAGAARFGATGGNIVTGTGTTQSAFSNDIFAVQQRFLDLQDPAGEILYGPEDVSYDKMCVVVPPELNEVAQRVSESEYLRVDATNTVSESNILKGTFEVKINNLLTDASDWFVILRHSYWKPFVVRQSKDIRSIWADATNSDAARERNIETAYMDLRTGIGLWAPFTIIKVNN